MILNRLKIAAGILLVLALAALAAWPWAVRWHPADATYAIQGVDVTAEQGQVDWFEARGAGVQFAYIRATDGTTRDARFADNWEHVDAAGLRRGALLVYSLCRPATEQADAFVTTVPRGGGALPVAVDLDFHEDCQARPSRDKLIDDLRNLLTTVETHTGTPTLLKVTRAFDTQYRVSEAIPRNLWSVQPFLAPGYFPRPWRMWQASSFRRVAGIERPTNWDVVAP